jgi:flagellar biosynthesis component FlhA
MLLKNSTTFFLNLLIMKNLFLPIIFLLISLFFVACAAETKKDTIKADSTEKNKNLEKKSETKNTEKEVKKDEKPASEPVEEEIDESVSEPQKQ